MIICTTESEPLLLDITLPIELANRNDGQGHSHWRTSADKKRFLKLLSFHTRTPFRYSTFVAVTRILGLRQKLWDYDSGLRGSWKQLQDAMVDCGWWHDDGPGYITGIVFRQDDSQRHNGPATRVQVWQSGTDPVRPKTDTATGSRRNARSKVSAKRPARGRTRSRRG